MKRPLFDKLSRDQLIELVLEQDALLRQKADAPLMAFNRKLCPSCGQYLKRTAFRKRRESKDGLQASCASCMNQKAAEWRAENSEYVKARNKANYQKAKQS